MRCAWVIDARVRSVQLGRAVGFEVTAGRCVADGVGEVVGEAEGATEDGDIAVAVGVVDTAQPEIMIATNASAVRRASDRRPWDTGGHLVCRQFVANPIASPGIACSPADRARGSWPDVAAAFRHHVRRLGRPKRRRSEAARIRAMPARTFAPCPHAPRASAFVSDSTAPPTRHRSPGRGAPRCRSSPAGPTPVYQTSPGRQSQLIAADGSRTGVDPVHSTMMYPSSSAVGRSPSAVRTLDGPVHVRQPSRS